MDKIVLLQLFLRYFKGVREFTLSTGDGADVDVYGDNAAGKTTLFDGFTWLLFDKDSQNKKDFDIKTLDESGKVLENGIDHEVEGVLLINGKRRTLRKVYAEKWTKKRGSAIAEFTGHTTEYFIDGVPAKKAEFDSFVSSIVKEDIFKLLTNPAYFNEQLDKKQRRQVLLEVCGDMSDLEVIEGNEGLRELPAILGDRSIEDHRKVLAARRADINKELEKIPIRIDESKRAMPDITASSEDLLAEQIEALKGRISGKESEMTRIQTGGEIAVKTGRLREIEGDLLDLKNNAQAEAMKAVNAKRKEASALKQRAIDIGYEMGNVERQIENNRSIIAEKVKEADRLRDQWNAVHAETFAGHSHAADCPTCGQALPEEQIEAAHAKALSAFNLSKSERKESIGAKGKAAKAEKERLEALNADLTIKEDVLRSQQYEAVDVAKAAEAELQSLEAELQEAALNPVYEAKMKEKAVVEQAITELRSTSLSSVEACRKELIQLRMEVESLERNKAKFGQVRAAQQRIEELKQQEKTLAAEYERLERELYLTEEFIRTKVSLLESKINSKFRYARFKLFEPQINGGLTETCETTFGGVPYGSGLNRAAQTNVGLDIINTLSEHYGFVAPIFIDNAEAVTELAETAGQQIRLIVSKPDKQLRIEMANHTQEEALAFE